MNNHCYSGKLYIDENSKAWCREGTFFGGNNMARVLWKHSTKSGVTEILLQSRMYQREFQHEPIPCVMLTITQDDLPELREGHIPKKLVTSHIPEAVDFANLVEPGEIYLAIKEFFGRISTVGYHNWNHIGFSFLFDFIADLEIKQKKKKWNQHLTDSSLVRGMASKKQSSQEEH